jgi:hypothetical protein
VDPASQSSALIFGWIGVGLVILFGIGLLFSRSTNIEREGLVGGSTLVGGLVATILLWRASALNGPYSWWQVAGILLVALAFYGWGRLVDYVLGPLPLDREADEATLGAHLSD